MKYVKGFFSIIFSIIFAIVILCVALLGILKSTISKEYVLSKINETKVYEELTDAVEGQTQKYIEENPENKEIIEKFVTKENVEELVTGYIDNLYGNDEFDTSLDGVENVLNENIEKIKEENNITLTDEQEQELDTMVQELVNECESAISDNNSENANDSETETENVSNVNGTNKTENGSIIDETENDSINESMKIINAIPEAIRTVNTAFLVSLLIAVALGIIILVLNICSISFGINSIASGFITSGIFLVVCKSYTGQVALKIIDQCTESLIIDIIESIASDLSQSLYRYGLIYICIGIILIVITIIANILKKKKVNKNTVSI